MFLALFTLMLLLLCDYLCDTIYVMQQIESIFSYILYLIEVSWNDVLCFSSSSLFLHYIDLSKWSRSRASSKCSLSSALINYYRLLRLTGFWLEKLLASPLLSLLRCWLQVNMALKWYSNMLKCASYSINHYRCNCTAAHYTRFIIIVIIFLLVSNAFRKTKESAVKTAEIHKSQIGFRV